MIYTGDCLEILPTLEAESVQCCVTSPPYWGLRDYGIPPISWPDGWIGSFGLEPTPNLYIAHSVMIFNEVHRVLRDDGTLWLNLGDTYAIGAGKIGQNAWRGSRGGHEGKHKYSEAARGTGPMTQPNRMPIPGLKSKDLVGIPWRVAFALQAEGWWLRSDVIWNKPNGMTESVTDRPTKSHEYIFLLTKAKRYYYDHEAIEEPQSESERRRRLREQKEGLNTVYILRRDQEHGQPRPGENGCARSVAARQMLAEKGTKNRRSVWTITTKPFKEVHFATFPPEIPEICIKAGSKRGDTILDPFSGAGTTGNVAERLGRKYIGIELNPAYADMGEKRIEAARLPLFEVPAYKTRRERA